jgi:hypothetical protein
VDLGAVTDELEADGVAAFCESYRQLLGEIAVRRVERHEFPAILAYLL